jgi:hypothetical protein
VYGFAAAEFAHALEGRVVGTQRYSRKAKCKAAQQFFGKRVGDLSGTQTTFQMHCPAARKSGCQSSEVGRQSVTVHNYERCRRSKLPYAANIQPTPEQGSRKPGNQAKNAGPFFLQGRSYELGRDTEIQNQVGYRVIVLASKPDNMLQLRFGSKCKNRRNFDQLRARANNEYALPHFQDLLWISAVICSEISPMREMITDALKTNIPIFVNRPIVKYV